MSLNIPGVAELENIAHDIDPAIAAAITVLDFVTKYGTYVPGIGSEIDVLKGLDSALKAVKSFLDHVPS